MSRTSKAAEDQAVAKARAEAEIAAKPAVAAPQEFVQPAVNPPQVNTGAEARKQPFVRRLKGIPVEPGQTLQDVHPSLIKSWFQAQEQRWKTQYNVVSTGTHMSIGRG